MATKVDTIYQEVKLDVVMKFFGDSFKSQDGGLIINKEWFVDTTKNAVIFRLTVIHNTPDVQNPPNQPNK